MGEILLFIIAYKMKKIMYILLKLNKEYYSNPNKNFISIQSVVADGRVTL